MRRKEFTIEQEAEIEAFLAEKTYGFLGTISVDGDPHITPLNFVYDNGYVYFHGSLAGEKMKHLKAKTRVSFNVAEEYALIPSYFSDPLLACPATAYFKSVTVFGHAEKVSDPSEKAKALSLFMNKLQPEGGYTPIIANDALYKGQLKAVAVIRIVPDRVTAKFKFGQNLEQSKHEKVQALLEERGTNKDVETAELMRKFCPFHTDLT
ncbi:pyridoxamine 5'-phosphate oxidase family protein [Paenibacillus gallinarum]|uniref:Pyridoxamine 5'-phosphate oxidase family protein n=1 Tax=Paenibacillus gallinarum TaxID=2762232 RepID=A0ABR8T1R5_9BACL|nr:pyridoxamine 5'-phosphate oxidase family protein [Paenibacillus gallinarum]MBD7969706.1 pyridoxamine 5'-phosphate oxidase family protein [Paenibacillus gallinarum]